VLFEPSGLPSYAVASHFLPCICRTGANATVKCLRAGCPSGGMLYRQTRQRLNVSSHSHPRHHRACTQPRSHGHDHIDLHGQLEPSWFPYPSKPSVVCPRECMESWQSFCSVWSQSCSICWTLNAMEMDVFFFMIKYRTFVSEEKKVICASLQFLSSMEGTFDKIPG